MAEISADYGSFKGVDGLSIFYRKYQADAEKARVVIAHGLGEHSGRYDNVVRRLLPKGFSIWAPDHRGHGQSGGPRGHVFSFYQYVDDLHSMIALSRDTLAEGAKIFLLGHSLGGLIALRFAARFPEVIDGVIISSPALGLPEEPPAIKAFVGRIMS
ncbi:MAG: alpha/beta fold hydrolase, partial [Syntrophales bacterium]|nr:alpha/beta fold hydrolase [Syntrophales bacterium]